MEKWLTREGLRKTLAVFLVLVLRPRHVRAPPACVFFEAGVPGGGGLC